jgi:hypothetical protein
LTTPRPGGPAGSRGPSRQGVQRRKIS